MMRSDRAAAYQPRAAASAPPSTAGTAMLPAPKGEAIPEVPFSRACRVLQHRGWDPEEHVAD